MCVQQLISGFVVLAFEPWLKMKLTLPSSAPESLINLQTIHLCFLSVFTAACAKMTASIIFIPYFFKTRQKNKKKPKTKQRRWDVSMHRCRFSTGVFVHLSLRRRQLLGASCDTSMSLYPSFYAQSPACCSILHQRVSLPICALNLKKKESCLFSASFIPSFSFHSWTSAAPSAISSAQATFFFLCFLMQTQTSDLEWPAVSVTVKKKKKRKAKGKCFLMAFLNIQPAQTVTTLPFCWESQTWEFRLSCVKRDELLTRVTCDVSCSSAMIYLLSHGLWEVISAALESQTVYFHSRGQ